MQKTHQNFAVQERGLILLESHPFIGVVQMLLLVVQLKMGVTNLEKTYLLFGHVMA